MTSSVISNSSFSTFSSPILEIISSLISSAKSTSYFDPVPLRIFKQFSSYISSQLLPVLSNSLATGIYPAEFKASYIKPLLNKPNLDINTITNFRPISQLLTMSKILERIASKQIVQYMSINRLFDPFQHVFRKFYSTETALNLVINDLLITLNNQHRIQQ